MKYTILILFFLNFYTKSSCQKDSILVINCFKYFVINGNITGQRTIYNQKTFDKQGHLVREMFYLDSIVQVKSIVFYFYDNNILISKEEYNNDNSVKKINRYYYNPIGQLSEELIYEPLNEQIHKIYKIVYSYQDTTLIKKLTYDDNNIWIEKTTFEYDGFHTIQKTKYKKGINEENLKDKTLIISVSGKRFVKSELFLNYFEGKKENKTTEYSYDSEPAEIETQTMKDQENNILEIIEIRYNKVGVQLNKAVKNKDGTLLEYYTLEQHNYLREPINMEMYQLQK